MLNFSAKLRDFPMAPTFFGNFTVIISKEALPPPPKLNLIPINWDMYSDLT